MSALVSELTTQGSCHTLTPLPFQHDPARSRVEGIGLGEMVRERAERGGRGWVLRGNNLHVLRTIFYFCVVLGSVVLNQVLELSFGHTVRDTVLMVI